nr:hypothetical protein Iba_chr09dCG12520 [Ipomoea batatas]
MTWRPYERLHRRSCCGPSGLRFSGSTFAVEEVQQADEMGLHSGNSCDSVVRQILGATYLLLIQIFMLRTKHCCGNSNYHFVVTKVSSGGDCILLSDLRPLFFGDAFFISDNERQSKSSRGLHLRRTPCGNGSGRFRRYWLFRGFLPCDIPIPAASYDVRNSGELRRRRPAASTFTLSPSRSSMRALQRSLFGTVAAPR